MSELLLVALLSICTPVNYCRLENLNKKSILVEVWYDGGNKPASLAKCGVLDKKTGVVNWGSYKWRTNYKDCKKFRGLK